MLTVWIHIVDGLGLVVVSDHNLLASPTFFFDIGRRQVMCAILSLPDEL